MSAGAAQLLHTGRSAEKNTLARLVDRVYKVKTTDKADDETVVLTASGLPDVGDPHPSWGGAFCTSVKSSPWADDSQTLWKVTAKYSTPTSQDNTEEDPTDRNDIVSIKTLPYTVPAIRDVVSGETIRNSADDQYDPPWEIQASHMQIQVQRNIASWSGTTAQIYSDTTNFYEMTIGGVTGAPNTFKMLSIEGTKKWAPDGTRYWEVHYDIEYRSETHTLWLLDQGLRQKVTVDGEIEIHNIQDAQGKDVKKAVKLDGAGHELAVDGTPFYWPWYVYRIISWASLGLPTSA